MKPVTLTGAEREQFLAAPHIGVRGVDVAEHYVQAMLSSGLESVTFSMRPERWAGVSFARIAAELA